MWKWAYGLAVPVLVVAIVYTAEPVKDLRLTRDDVLVTVADDLSATPGLPQTTRYLYLGDLDDEQERDDAYRLINGQLQVLSSSSSLYPTFRCGKPGTPAGMLLRIDTSLYGATFQKQWERLGRQEPFWHGVGFVPTGGYTDKDYGYYYDQTGNAHSEPGPGRKFKKTETRRVPTDQKFIEEQGFFLRTPKGKEAWTKIQKFTGGTDVPVVSAKWFYVQTAAAFERDPGYYEFTGIKDIRSYEALIGFTNKEVDKSFLEEIRGAVAVSGVGLPDVLRRVVRRRALGGGYWLTQDANQRVAKFDPRANPLTNLGDDYIFQALETIGYRANGFPLPGLFNAAGVKQDRAPDSIATDKTSLSNDKMVHVPVSCTRCHVDSYLKDFKDWARSTLNKYPNFLAVTRKDGEDYHDFDKRLARERQQYVTTYLEPGLKEDRTRYREALWQVTKLEPGAYAGLVKKYWYKWGEQPVTREVAARDLGCTADEIEKRLVDTKVHVDPPLSAFRLPDPDEIPVVTWWQSYQRGADAMYGVVRPFNVRTYEE